MTNPHQGLNVNPTRLSLPPLNLRVFELVVTSGMVSCVPRREPRNASRSRSPALATLHVPYVLVLLNHTSGSDLDVMPDR